jgi:tetratricopeptide (TPR) repeat protein
LRFWIVRGYLGEGRRLLEPLLRASDEAPDLLRSRAGMEALHTAAFAALFQGDFEPMRFLAEQWLALAQDLGEEQQIWLAKDMLARVFMNRGDYQLARAMFVEQLTAMRRLHFSFGIASALVGLGVVARLQGDYESAIACCQECLAEARQSGDLWFIGQALSNLGLAYYQLGQYGVARKHFAEALTLRRELRDRSGVAWSLINLGDVATAQGDLVGARTQYEESVVVLQHLGDRSGRAAAAASLGRLAWAQSDFAAARLCFLESLTLQRDLGQRVAMPQILEELAGLEAARGKLMRALTLASAAAMLRDTVGSPRTSDDQDRIEAWSTPIRQALGGKASDAQTAAEAMTLEQAIAYALADEEPAAGDAEIIRWR